MDWSVLITVGTAIGVGNVPIVIAGVWSQWLFYRAVRGTRLRYVAQSIYHAFLVIQVFAGPLMLISYILAGDWVWAIIYSFIVPMMVWNLYRYRTRERDDDDFWSGLGGRIKKLLTRPLRVVVPATR